jgi:hypothetical protein
VGSLGNPGAGDPAPPSVHASHSAAAGRVARIPATGTSATRLDTEVRQYAAGDLSAVGTPLALPPIVDGSTVAPAYGKFVFYDVGGTKLHVVESTEATGYRWGVATLTP